MNIGLRSMLGALVLAAAGCSAPAERTFVPLELSQIRGLALDADGNLYIPDLPTSRLYRLTPDGVVSVVPTAPIVHVHAPAIAPDGTIYVVETEVSRVHRLTPDGAVPVVPLERKDVFLGATSIVFDPAGNMYIGAAARFGAPRGLAADAAGNVYVMDTNNAAVRKITPDGVVTTFAGKAGEPGFADGPVAAARFNGLRAGIFDPAGNLFLADEANGAVRMISPSGVVRTIAGVLPKS